MPGHRSWRSSGRRPARSAFLHKLRRWPPEDSQNHLAGGRQPLTWPANAIPMELFIEITSFLSRSDVENLRAVNKEFELKLASQYFRNVVVPFNAELYTAQSNEARDGDHQAATAQTLSHADSILSNGMRIFQSFGHHIVRFALSLEISEDHLAYPPVKTLQQAVPTYWGIYRWPVNSYARYAEIENLEDTADETLRLKEALTSLTQVKDLGLSCDAGLGYLCGPDRDTRILPPPHPVFGLRNVSYGSLQLPEQRPRRTAVQGPRDTKLSVLESMVRRAGFTEAQTPDAIETLLNTEGATLSGIEFDERAVPTPAPAPTTVTPTAQDPLPEVTRPAPNPDNVRRLTILQQRWGNPPATYPLQPKELTRGQLEMILEMDWAHRALIQSYVIAILDHSRASRFSSLTSLTIAKIPSSHINMFQRHDLWDSLPTLRNLTLAVVPDWRAVSKASPEHSVEETTISPLLAVNWVFVLLSEYISHRRNITFFHFEWICGGEFAPGVYQRNNYVLPAPFCHPTAMFEPHTAISGPILALPYIRHFSLKNCYATPHVLNQVIRTMALSSLQTLEFESVSLTGPLRLKPVPTTAMDDTQPAFQPAVVFGSVAVAAANQVAIPTLIQVDESDSDDDVIIVSSNIGFRLPSQMSWAGFINHFTPGMTVEGLAASLPAAGRPKASGPRLRHWLPEGDSFRRERKSGLYKLKSISFKSCGYARHVEVNTITPIDSEEPWADHDVAMRRKELENFMQVCGDHGIAKIVNMLSSDDETHFGTTWNMTQGWTGVYDAGKIRDAQMDGILEPGRGRFSGFVTGPRPPLPTGL
ncbi:uncharacterized protein VDAG_04608 [Verticillium dahliae VdLs.17]|uniref:F-box domain-containing protein n=2 Tax=Verticillium dahliae TaxID=27337 RepID=G2X3M1_VERDV|nr:uncharacterized protein VDAG_04608 [Verticillium dahliae VdLs.17]EGY23170.1 hypothetical protein VDAG_04608 [Verticillium dahliae VdLs.17]KAH6689304.1 hypothetical protein EV126DRAFT_118486 [Verticillium dahliae]